jgi:hypothetical protein
MAAGGNEVNQENYVFLIIEEESNGERNEWSYIARSPSIGYWSGTCLDKIAEVLLYKALLGEQAYIVNATVGIGLMGFTLFDINHWTGTLNGIWVSYVGEKDD